MSDAVLQHILANSVDRAVECINTLKNSSQLKIVMPVKKI